MITVRRSAAALVVSAVLSLALAPGAVADEATARALPPSAAPSSAAPASAAPSSAAPSSAAVLPPGLYGTKDPTRDGVWRQSLAMLGQFTSHFRPANEAIRWLKAQQCANGAFPTYRADPTAPCDVTTALDVDATAAAVQALSTLGGQRAPMDLAMNWLRFVQNEDGGWGPSPGTRSDAKSTSLVIGALTVAGVRPSSVLSVHYRNPYDALVGLSIPCHAGTGAGAFAFRLDASGKPAGARADATAMAVLGGIGKRMVTSPVPPGPAPSCVTTADPAPERAARNGAAYLAGALAATGHLDRLPPPGTAGTGALPRPDPGSTANAIVALTAGGYGDQASGALEWLKKNSAAWAQEAGPAAYAQLIFVAHTTDTDPGDFGGIDLVERLNATGPTPKAVPLTPAELAAASAAKKSQAVAGAEDSLAVAWIIGVGLIAVTGIGLLLRGRRAGRPV
ncbi:prenyltransferase/squalene oxidase repeat-containing protein [Streptomyces sp. NPDC051569]|uniref:prenyltransferase/squalene oxidase repeat-containing protein n=1 Tax=Streptomyces sp. NPDC051569 TaxID=3365661 RepID=UPI0037ACA436